MTKRVLWIAIVVCWSVCLRQAVAQQKTLEVAADGSGEFTSVQAAINAAPEKTLQPVVIHIKPGTYKERIRVPKNVHVTLRGDDAATTILTFDYNAKSVEGGKEVGTSGSYSTLISAWDFTAENITFENSAGEVGQAVAFRTTGQRNVLKTAGSSAGRTRSTSTKAGQYFKDCYIEGRVDFIFGHATAVFENCTIHSKNGGYVTAANTPPEQPYGCVFLNCKLTGEGDKAYLGRPWRPDAAVAFINCELGDHIRPEGWHNWNKPDAEKTARYAEYKCTGPGADRSQRVRLGKRVDRRRGRCVHRAKHSRRRRQLGSNGEVMRSGSSGIQHLAWNLAALLLAAAIVGCATTRPATQPAPKLRIVLVGDSTVTEKSGLGLGFKALLADDVECINTAQGGRSSRSFRDEGHWDKAVAIKADYMLIQFGHNDQPGKGPERETDPNTTYRENMKRYVTEARAAGMTPVLVTSLTAPEFRRKQRQNQV